MNSTTTTKRFKQYFKNNYVDRKHEWAHCYRQIPTINTNMYMYVEAFHNKLC